MVDIAIDNFLRGCTPTQRGDDEASIHPGRVPSSGGDKRLFFRFCVRGVLRRFFGLKFLLFA